MRTRSASFRSSWRRYIPALIVSLIPAMLIAVPALAFQPLPDGSYGNSSGLSAPGLSSANATEEMNRYMVWLNATAAPMISFVNSMTGILGIGNTTYPGSPGTLPGIFGEDLGEGNVSEGLPLAGNRSSPFSFPDLSLWFTGSPDMSAILP